MSKLPKSFYTRDTLKVAEDLIGKFLVRETGEGRIVSRINEVEAYIGRMDKASHAYGYRRSKRNEMLFHEGGVAYVYLIYGIYQCLNTVTETDGEPSGVLIRGGEVIDGKDIAAQNRFGKDYHELTKHQIKNLTDGPGKLGKALRIEKDLNGVSLSGDILYLCDEYGENKACAGEIKKSKRIGIDYAEEAADFLWRFRG